MNRKWFVWCTVLTSLEIALVAPLSLRRITPGAREPIAKEPDVEIQAALLGAGAAAAVTLVMWLAQRYRERRMLTFDFHRELSSAEFGLVRARADTFLKKHPHGSFEDVSREARDVADDTSDLNVNIWVVARFYQRLEIARLHNELEVSLLPELFGDIFYWWFHKHFKDRLVVMHSDYETSRAIDSFNKWLEQNATREQKERWRRNLVSAA